MANSERTFQAELLEQFRSAKWHAFKITTPFLSGVPDLYIKAPLQPAVWIELKFMKYPGKVALTDLQRKFIRDEHKVGGRAGWAVCVDGKDLYAGNNPEIVSLGLTYRLQHRERGEAWNIHNLLEKICGQTPAL